MISISFDIYIGYRPRKSMIVDSIGSPRWSPWTFFSPSEFQVFHGHGKIWHHLKSWLMWSQLSDVKWLDVTRYFCWNPHLWWLNLVKSRNGWWLNPPFFETPMVFGSSESSALRLVNLVSPVADLTCDIKKEAPSQMMGWFHGHQGHESWDDMVGIWWGTQEYWVYNGITGWWFGTYCIFSYIGKNHPNWRTHIFQRGSNHQPVTYIVRILERYYPGYDTQEKRRGLLKTTLG